ncbi:hypothetical protein VD659_18125 [Herbiconiux sp. 11R-BC]|uniref:hypothetical protein n=1 Tax=Herbiconiux sp. 11R-BC TaxID=3111637 RepID=UPI003BFD9E56
MRASETVHAEPAFSLDAPNYRVNFWQRSGEGAWVLDAFVLTEVRDVSEALEWAEVQANGRPFELFAEGRDEPVGAFGTPRTSGLVRLFGENPNVGEPVVIGRFRKV